MKLVSPAKLNLGLWIVGRNAAGYHLLESLFWPIDLADEISIEKARATSVQIDWAEPSEAPLPPTSENILTILLKKNPQLGNWNITVRKKIPIGGGLGGGSSNAGTVLRFFVQEGLVSLDAAKTIAFSLGADVPYFLNPVPCWVSGIGEICRPLEVATDIWENLRFALVLPPIHCSTPEIFKLYRESGAYFSSRQEIPNPEPVRSPHFAEFLKRSKNALEQTVAAKEPLIQNGLTSLRNLKSVNVALSGSGSTFYATFLSDAQCEENAKDVQQFCRKHHCRYIKVVSFQGAHHGNHRSKSISS